MAKRTTIVLFFALLILSACSATAAPTLPPDLAGTTWHLNTIDGNPPIVHGQPLELSFDPDNGSIAGFGGCNRFSGNYHLSGDNQITFTQLSTTLRECIPSGVMEQEQHFFNLLRDVTNYTLTPTTFTLQTSAGETLIFVRS
ncbi:MAG: META domain-containing protein [Candidatus Viridilinea halotolerans]|uniref:META domain-containing protein n=1 Tax=Candidatus Viridilinea halotolerans TaxID=2491704 RepID=A0A426U698_9CHLR|nr:MAG: META domain-containing protein [Candidatus Viridilinea halotolerans]